MSNPIAGEKKSYSVTIRWGGDNYRREAYKKGERGEEFVFDTEAEMNAFLIGVDAMYGYTDYVITEQDGVLIDSDNDIYE